MSIADTGVMTGARYGGRTGFGGRADPCAALTQLTLSLPRDPTVSPTFFHKFSRSCVL